ncbi:NAD(P)-dependent alcohol dehydrogenase [Mycolicibacterium sediminis]|uniref:Aryl-alcohol dehydrogenase n=1 Tax=Mycolicibacterium sediminis TaxID=1286180 RepID=A0A7I7QRG8_9MYCO|nr:NAD(P)-dependent alcohol dehydrogenase [Mycolicibacterium sediminis]BBY28812.1 aryl-alcohol dehydrogenase [Mycolicibacterium sediminis]
MIEARAAVLLDEGSQPRLTDVQIRGPIRDEVLVRIDAVGICHTDVSLAARWPAKRMPMTFGHEGAGTVVATGPDSRRRGGEQVVLTFDSCGSCGACASGAPAYCDHATTLNMRGDRGDEASALRLDGHPIRGGFFGQSSFATHALARSANAIPIGESIDPALAAPLGCSVQTGVGTVLNALAAGADDTVVVFGAGGVGLSAVMGARIAGCRAVVAVDPVAERRSLATRLGATTVVDPADGDVAAAVVEATGGGASLAVDTTAVPDVLAGACAALRAGGTLALVGLGALMAPLPVGLIMARGLRVRGVVEGDSDPHAFIPRLADLVRSGDLPVGEVVTRFAFDDFDAAWSAATSGGAVKPVLVMPRQDAIS